MAFLGSGGLPPERRPDHRGRRLRLPPAPDLQQRPAQGGGPRAGGHRAAGRPPPAAARRPAGHSEVKTMKKIKLKLENSFI